jgi:hypothetical protein
LRNLEHVFRAGKYVKPARIATLTAKDLGYASKVDNVNGLDLPGEFRPLGYLKAAPWWMES